jgi:predicted dehydrogenase
MVRLGIVGAGGIAGRHIASLEQIADTQVTAVLDTDTERARNVARSCASLDELLDLVDMVYILTPPSTHAQIACAAAAAGNNLFDLERLHWKTDQMPHERIDVINDRNDLSGFVSENEHFIGCIRDAKEPDVTGEDGLRALQISHAILESSRLGSSVQPAELR